MRGSNDFVTEGSRDCYQILFGQVKVSNCLIPLGIKEKINNLTGKEAKHLNRYKGIKKNYLKMDKL